MVKVMEYLKWWAYVLPRTAKYLFMKYPGKWARSRWFSDMLDAEKHDA